MPDLTLTTAADLRTTGQPGNPGEPWSRAQPLSSWPGTDAWIASRRQSYGHDGISHGFSVAAMVAPGAVAGPGRAAVVATPPPAGWPPMILAGFI